MRRAAAILTSSLFLLAACGGAGSVFVTTTAPGSSTSEATTSSAAATTSSEMTTITEAPTSTEAPTTTVFVPSPVATPDLDEESFEVPAGCEGVGFSVTAPVVSGLTPAAQEWVNGQITLVIERLKGQYVADATGACGPADLPEAQLIVAYEATTLSARLISLRFTGSAYYPGAAHPQTLIFTMNFDAASGDELQLADILLAGGESAVAALAEQHLVDEYYGGDPAGLHDWVATITTGMLGNWAVSGAGLEITFDQYAVGPGSMGTPTVVIPWGQLVGIVDPAGPAGPA
jgi:hypothetical protein